MHGRVTLVRKLTYNWPQNWSPDRPSIATGDDRWQYDNYWKRVLSNLDDPFYIKPELDHKNIRSYASVNFAADLKDDIEGFGHKARFVNHIDFAPASFLVPTIDRYTGLMWTSSVSQHGQAASNSFATMLQRILDYVGYGFDDWLPMPLSVYNALETRNTLVNPRAPIADANFWLASAGTTAGNALIITGGGGNVTQQAITAGTARNSVAYRKYF